MRVRASNAEKAVRVEPRTKPPLMSHRRCNRRRNDRAILPEETRSACEAYIAALGER